MAHSTQTQSPTAPPPPAERGAAGVTVRAVTLACLVLPLNAYWITQMAVVRYRGHPTTVSLFFNVVFILFMLVVINRGLRLVWPRIALHRNELLVIYAMVCIASALCGHDLVQVVAPQIIMPHWLATPENKWEELFLDHIPHHVTISNPAIYRDAFLGESTLYTAPRLAAWAVPVASWGGLLIGLSTMMLAANALLRKRWMQREKLSYPITLMPLELTRTGVPLLRNKAMWIAFGLAGLVNVINGIHELMPAWPLLKVRVVHFDQYLGTLFRGHPWGALAGTRISFYPFGIGLGFLLPLDLAFSCWFFYLFWKAQALFSTLFGFNRIPGFPYVNEQSSAAYLALCGFSLWMARDHLRHIVQGAMRAVKWEDEGEPMGYGPALKVLGIGAVLVVVFMTSLGMQAWTAVLFMVLYFALSLTVTRIRAEVGPPAHDLHRGGPDLILTNIFGTSSAVFDTRGLTAMSLCFWFNRAYRAHPMPIQLESLKIAEMAGIRPSSMATALTIATVLGVIAAFWAQVHCYYVYGIDAKMSSVANTFGREPFVRLASWLNHPQGTDWPRIGAYLAAIGFTLGLMFLRTNFTWWPFHPVGYAISGSWSMNCLWLPIFIAWLCKAVILRYGGYRLVQAAVPFALGLVLGEFIIGSLWTIIGTILQINTYSFWV